MILLLTPSLGNGNEGKLRLSQSMTSGHKKCPGIGTMNTDGRNYIHSYQHNVGLRSRSLVQKLRIQDRERNQVWRPI